MALEIQHKKSAVSGKLPLPSDLEPGEIALNYHANGPFLTCKDTSGNIRKLNHIWVSASAPSNPTTGDAWYDISTDPGILYLYKDDADTWQQLTQTVTVATTAAFGTVRLADAAAVANGTSGRVIDAAQLQSAISGYSITLNGSAPISIGGSSSQPNISINPGAANQVLRTNASGTGVEFSNNIDLPGTLSVQGGFSIGATTITTGTGSPEGSVAAPVGSLYLRTDGTPNNTLYVKESGSGNSGWGAVPTQALLLN